MKGGDSGEPAVASGKPESSPLYLAVTRVHESWSAMPPKEADRLSEQELRWLKQWIIAGAILAGRVAYSSDHTNPCGGLVGRRWGASAHLGR
jgi:hypothetical protein